MTTLTTLPPELRLQIYDLVLGETKPLFLPFSSSSSSLSYTSKSETWISPPISRVCSVLRRETIHLHSHTHKFVYDLSSPLDQGLVRLERVLQDFKRQGVRLGKLRFRHVNEGVLSVSELEAWVLLFLRYRDVLPFPDGVGFCERPLRNRVFANQVAVALKQLIGFAARLNEGILGSGEEVAIREWIEEDLGRTEEGRAVLGCVRFVGDVLAGFRGVESRKDDEFVRCKRLGEVKQNMVFGAEEEIGLKDMVSCGV